MEFASEMVVRASLADLDIREVPTVLHPDGRTRAPHLRTWNDGWRHLRFLLLYSPRWLFLIPGLVTFFGGLVATLVLTAGDLTIGTVTLSVNTLVYAAAATIIGFQAVTFALFTKIYAVAKGFLPADSRLDRLAGRFRLERGLGAGIAVLLVGLVVGVVSLLRWRDQGFGELETARRTPRGHPRRTWAHPRYLHRAGQLLLVDFGHGQDHLDELTRHNPVAAVTNRLS